MRARSKIETLLHAGLLAGVLGLMSLGAAVAQPAPFEAGCRMAGVLNASAAEAVADTFVIPFAANSSELTPVAEQVLEAASASYPQQQTLYLQVRGGETPGQTETLVSIDRLTWITAFLTARDVPLEAMVFEAPAVAQMGCAASAAVAL